MKPNTYLVFKEIRHSRKIQEKMKGRRNKDKRSEDKTEKKNEIERDKDEIERIIAIFPIRGSRFVIQYKTKLLRWMLIFYRRH
ncbi:hypothetical protein RclHR1_02480021 [Rhizophagus clarus]|uniref:Uncharacterized protein n=1 Tax=Rhizophagus clarus TaxID=94130 RepID=A0A2Z6R2T7_9GLOM|nr:hypothetical protein RclHR1_02480021 [Rhizophagus clarus]